MPHRRAAEHDLGARFEGLELEPGRPLVPRRGAHAVRRRAPTPERSTTSPTSSTARRERAGPTTQPTEDDNVTVQGVAGDRGALGYFGFSYFEENQGRLKALEVDGGSGCVAPSSETAQDGTYTPLSRPLFVYVKRASFDENEDVRNFIEFMLDNNTSIAEAAQFVPLSDGAARRGADEARGSDAGLSDDARRRRRQQPSLALPRKRIRWGEQLVHGILFLAAAMSVLTTLGIVVSLLLPAIDFFGEVSPWDFLTGTTWTPLFLDGEFGVVPLVVGTIMISF